MAVWQHATAGSCNFAKHVPKTLDCCAGVTTPTVARPGTSTEEQPKDIFCVDASAPADDGPDTNKAPLYRMPSDEVEALLGVGPANDDELEAGERAAGRDESGAMGGLGDGDDWEGEEGGAGPVTVVINLSQPSQTDKPAGSASAEAISTADATGKPGGGPLARLTGA